MHNKYLDENNFQHFPGEFTELTGKKQFLIVYHLMQKVKK